MYPKASPFSLALAMLVRDQVLSLLSELKERSQEQELTGRVKRNCKMVDIHLIPKWRSINYSFVCMLISPLRLVNMYKKQKNFEVKTRRRGLINMQTKE